MVNNTRLSKTIRNYRVTSIRSDLSSSIFTVVDTLIKTGDLLLEIGYKESDTIANGRLYYQAALTYYLKPMGYYKNNYHLALGGFLERKVMLLITVLGGGFAAIRSWCEESYISGPGKSVLVLFYH